MPVKSYRDLVVWQKSMELVEEVYQLTRPYPKSEEYGLKSQMRRAAVSVPSNIAEGQARNHPREFLQFSHIAMGSLSELETQIELSIRLSILSRADTEKTVCLCQEVGKMLHGLANSLYP